MIATAKRSTNYLRVWYVLSISTAAVIVQVSVGTRLHVWLWG